VASRRCDRRAWSRAAELLHHQTVLDPRAREVSAHLWRRQQLRRVEQQIVAVDRHAVHVFRFHQVLEFDPEKIQHTLGDEAGGLDRRRMEAEAAVGRRGHRRLDRERHRHAFLERARLRELSAVNANRDVLDRRVLAGEDVMVHQIRQALRRHCDTSGVDRHDVR